MDSSPPSEPKDRPITLATAAIWTLLARFLYVLFVSMTEAGRQGAVFDLVSLTACEAIAYSIVFFAILRTHEPQTSIRHVLAFRSPSVIGIVLALAVGAALSLPTEWLAQVLDGLFPQSLADKEALERLLSIPTIGKRVTLVLTVAVLQPALEELFFRGAIFTPLRRTRGAETVIVASAALETLGSLSPRTMLSLLGATLVFAWIRGATGSIFPSMAARMAFYGVTLVPIALGHAAPKPTKAVLVSSAIVAVVGLLGLQLLSRRDARLVEARRTDGE